MRTTEFEDFLREGRNATESEINASVAAVQAFAADVSARGRTLAMATPADVRHHLDRLIEAGDNTWPRLVALARYAYFADLTEPYVYLAGVMAGREVIPSMADRAAAVAGPAVREAVFDNLDLPPLGAPTSELPAVAHQIVAGLTEATSLEVRRRILAGNHHGMPAEPFTKLRKIYEAEGIDAALAYRHENLVSTLAKHAESGKPWYEQVITPEVVDYVRADREISAGVRRGDSIYVTKIAYAPVQFLAAEDPTEKRYHLCHCPWARESIIADGPTVPAEFCYCSAGYAKWPFEVVFGQELEVELLESALGGDPRCRFAIKLPASQ